jgi:hypothetical protein
MQNEEEWGFIPHVENAMSFIIEISEIVTLSE